MRVDMQNLRSREAQDFGGGMVVPCLRSFMALLSRCFAENASMKCPMSFESEQAAVQMLRMRPGSGARVCSDGN